MAALPFECGYTFTCRSAGGYHVFDHEDAFALAQLESSAECHLAVLAFCPNKPHIQRFGYCKADNYTANRGRRDRLNFEMGVSFSDRSAESRCISCVLQRQGALQILRAMQSAGQYKMSVKECFTISKMR